MSSSRKEFCKEEEDDVKSIKNSNNEFYQSLDKHLWFWFRIIFKNEAELFYEEGMKKVIQVLND